MWPGHIVGSWSTWCLPGPPGLFLQSCFPAGQRAARAGAWRCPSEGQDFALPLAELVGAPASAGYDPRLTQRAGPSRESAQEEGFGCRCSEAAPGSTGWWESRAPGRGGRGCGEEEDEPGVMSGGARAGPGEPPAGNICPGSSLDLLKADFRQAEGNLLSFTGRGCREPSFWLTCGPARTPAAGPALVLAAPGH